MTKDQLQKELKEKIIEGVKPSTLKKLKKSKSDGDLPKVKSQPLKKSQSQLEIPLAPPSPTTKIKELEDKVSVLELKLDTKDRELETNLLAFSQKDKELQEKQTELDNSLFARVAAVKQFGLIYDKLSQIRKELDDMVEQASDELLKGDDKNSQLRTKLLTARQQISSLQKDLNLAERLAEMRKVPLPDDQTNWDYLKPALYAFGAITLTIWLLRKDN